LTDTVKRVLWTFALAFLGSFFTLAPGLLKAPNFKDTKAAVVSATIAGIAAAASYVKNRLFPPGHPAR
jgi:hypothetical protein